MALSLPFLVTVTRLPPKRCGFLLIAPMRAMRPPRKRLPESWQPCAWGRVRAATVLPS